MTGASEKVRNQEESPPMYNTTIVIAGLSAPLLVNGYRAVPGDRNPTRTRGRGWDRD